MNYNDIKEFAPSGVDEQVRLNHADCPAGVDTHSRLYIKRTRNAVLAYCHNCGGYVVKANRGTPRNYITEKLIAEAAISEVLLPADATPNLDDWPHAARAWLYQYGLDDADIATHNICYSESWGRIILPVYEGGKLVFWQGRSITGTPKYISVKGAKKPLFIASCREPCPLSARYAVVVEDMISAIAASKAVAGWDGVALLGTHDSDDLPSKLAEYTGIYIWLDPDEAGTSKALALHQRLRTVGLARFVWLQTKEQAPKHLSVKDIQRILQTPIEDGHTHGH